MTTTPRTRKQLREALQTERNRYSALRGALSAAGIETRTTSSSFIHSFFSEFITEVTNAITDGAHARALEENTVAVRRETLEAVIKALQLQAYGYRDASGIGLYHFGIDPDKRPGYERLWSDIQTALKVREEAKLAEERKKTEEKVAGLAPKHAFAAGGTVSLSDADRDLLATIGNLSSDPGPGVQSYGAASSIPKPAKKKSEAKK
ncbi:hypothetical protein [Streptomyces sp. AC495_CC817]|uniref:hypothetical protein n=1 Tax=Streptomyces sp. AC495_CC817 TaxID=2823900 RepID=UPI001C25A360|nr:hypothetical protein [Streptomyces sp. AC495_CC817]